MSDHREDAISFLLPPSLVKAVEDLASESVRQCFLGGFAAARVTMAERIRHVRECPSMPSCRCPAHGPMHYSASTGLHACVNVECVLAHP